MRLKPLAEQVVVIFGASSGIGRATALKFARAGARVVVAARSQDGLDSLVREIKADGGKAHAVVAEATDFQQVSKVADVAVARFGRLDTWVHLAAVSIYALFRETTPEEFRRVIDVNLVGQAYGAMAALPHLRAAGGGALIHVSSVESEVALPYQSAYASSKHGMTGFLDTLRLELAHEGIPISVTNVKPASINTPFFNKARTKLGVKPKGIPPIYEPELVADAILYAATHPMRDIAVGDAGKLLILGKRFVPSLVDAMLVRVGFAGQKTNEPKSVKAPDNLFAPLPGFDQVHGDFSTQATSISLWNWLQTHPMIKRLLAGTALSAVALMGRRITAQK